MIKAWIVIRKEKHLDDDFWVCLAREDAVKIANDVADYWIDNYGLEVDGLEDNNRDPDNFYVSAEDAFSVDAFPQDIREVGETAPRGDG